MDKIKRKFTKNISSHVLQISAISLLLPTREITDIFNAFDEIYFGIQLKKVNILYLFFSRHIMGVRFLTICSLV